MPRSLLKILGVSFGLAVTVGNTIGAGILRTPGDVATALPNPWLFLGVWLVLGCFGYLAFSFTGLLFPGHEDKVFTYSQPLMFAEVAIMLWLSILGARPTLPLRRSSPKG